MSNDRFTTIISEKRFAERNIQGRLTWNEDVKQAGKTIGKEWNKIKKKSRR